MMLPCKQFKPIAGTASRSRGVIRPRFAGKFLALEERAQGMPGAQCARSLAGQKKQAMPVTVTTVTPEKPGIPRTMVLRLISCSPR
jgi:hypothetical protein